MALGYTDVGQYRDLAEALHQWRRWADGHPVPAESVAHIVEVLRSTSSIDRVDAITLVTPVAHWAANRRLDVPSPAAQPTTSLGIDLGL